MHSTIQQKLVRTMVRRWREPLSAHVATLGLGPDVEHIATGLDALDSELQPGVTEALDNEEVQAAREQLHEAGCALLSRVLAHFAVDADAPRKRERVLAELNRQLRLVAEARSRHRPVLDVDPETGVEVDPDDAVVTPTDGG